MLLCWQREARKCCYKQYNVLITTTTNENDNNNNDNDNDNNDNVVSK